MKKILNAKAAGVIAVTLLVFSTTFSSAATFTAVASGNWSNSTTWGGSVPPATIISDQVIIPSGLNVVMDNSVALNGALAQLDINGTLSSSSSEMLSVIAGIMTGTGIIGAGTVVLQTAAVISFSGSLMANTLTCNVLNLPVTADIMVNQTLNLAAGVLMLQTGSSLDLGANATIVISGGIITLNGGTVGLSNSYNVEYISGSAVAGVELTGTGLSDVTVDVGAGNTVTLTSDLTVTGMLNLTTGTLVLAANDLTITGNGNIDVTGNGNISSSSASDITISTAASVTGPLTFTAFTSSGNIVNNFTVNIASEGSVTLGSDLIISGMLNLVNGHLNVASYNAEIAMGGSISGGSASAYVTTGISGTLSMHLAAGAAVATLFPLGTPTNFCPAGILLNSGSASGEVFVGAIANVYAQGTSGADISVMQPTVDATWFIHSEITANLDMNITLMWPSAAEVNAFNRAAAYISHNVAGSWDAYATASANIETNGMYSLTRANVTSLSPFAVFDQNTIPTDVIETADLVSFDIYPNPAADFVNVKYNELNTQPLYIEVVDILGSRLYSGRLTRTNTIIPVEKFIPGNYFIRIYNDNMSTVKKFVKM